MHKTDDQIFLGLVAKGDGRGKELGFPTANIDLSKTLYINRDVLVALVSGNDHLNLQAFTDSGITDQDFPASADDIFLATCHLIEQLIERGKVTPGDRNSLSIRIFNSFATATNQLADNSSLNSGGFLLQSGLLANGVYAGRACCETDEIWPCAVSVGTREHFYDSGVRLLEAHLIGFSGDIYDRLFLLQITHFLREQQKFTTLEELISQIQEDVFVVSQISDIN